MKANILLILSVLFTTTAFGFILEHIFNDDSDFKKEEILSFDFSLERDSMNEGDHIVIVKNKNKIPVDTIPVKITTSTIRIDSNGIIESDPGMIPKTITVIPPFQKNNTIEYNSKDFFQIKSFT